MADEKKPQVEPEPVFKAKDRKSADKPIIAADGHVVLSQEDIDNRDA